MSKDNKEFQDKASSPFFKNLKNIGSKIAGVVGLGILGYITLGIVLAITIFIAKIVLAVAFTHAIFTNKNFKMFRHHFSLLVGDPIQAMLFNKLILPVMNTLIGGFNALCDTTKAIGYYKMDDFEENTPLGTKILVGLQTALLLIPNFFIFIRNQLDITHFKMPLYEPCTAEDINARREATSGEPIKEKGSWVTMGFGFLTGTFGYVKDKAIAFKNLFSRPFKAKEYPVSSNNSIVVFSKKENSMKY